MIISTVDPSLWALIPLVGPGFRGVDHTGLIRATCGIRARTDITKQKQSIRRSVCLNSQHTANNTKA